jgi:hypothetical protein
MIVILVLVVAPRDYCKFSSAQNAADQYSRLSSLTRPVRRSLSECGSLIPRHFQIYGRGAGVGRGEAIGVGGGVKRQSGVGRPADVGHGLGVGEHLPVHGVGVGVGVGVAVAVGVAITVAVAVAVGVGVGV